MWLLQGIAIIKIDSLIEQMKLKNFWFFFWDFEIIQLFCIKTWMSENDFGELKLLIFNVASLIAHKTVKIISFE